ncbi:hypothetical protein C7W93_07320 [Glaciimonas sp. PCH181]|nr:hypothetical protein C7W93_07320 [Glaciimonas sp. PCH181]
MPDEQNPSAVPIAMGYPIVLLKIWTKSSESRKDSPRNLAPRSDVAVNYAEMQKVMPDATPHIDS